MILLCTVAILEQQNSFKFHDPQVITWECLTFENDLVTPFRIRSIERGHQKVRVGSIVPYLYQNLPVLDFQAIHPVTRGFNL